MRYLLVVATFLLVTISVAKVRNGYSSELQRIKIAIHRLSVELQESSINSQTERRLKRLRKKFVTKQKETLKMYQRTEAIIKNFKRISPELLSDADNVKDAEGNITDVYVSAVYHMGSRDGVLGVTNLGYSNRNRRIYASRFGDKTVEIKVNAGPKATTLLAHEIGHVLYQVPNLASYIGFYQKAYGPKGGKRGHRPDDPSHQSVVRTMNKFYTDYMEILQVEGPVARFMSLLKKPMKKLLKPEKHKERVTVNNPSVSRDIEIPDVFGGSTCKMQF